MSAEKVKNSGQPPTADFGDDLWYERFMSIIFGVFIAVWIVPFSAMRLTKENDESFVMTLALEFHPRGLLMFVVLVCLWWWYARFIGQIRPATSFYLFLFDFITLGSFALAFRFWSDDSAYPVTIIAGSLLMFIRFFTVLGGIKTKRSIHWVVKAALVLSGLMFFGSAVSVGTLVAFHSYEEAQKDIELVLEIIVTLLLIAGIYITFVAVYLTETLSLYRPQLHWYTKEQPE